jgi:hypothetical protein
MHPKVQIDWDKPTCSKFTAAVSVANNNHGEMAALTPSIENINTLATYITDVLHSALDSVSPPPVKPSSASKTGKPPISREASTLIQQKRALLKSITSKSKTARILKFHQVHRLQDKLQKLGFAEKRVRDIRWWKLLKAHGARMDSRAFYKEVAKLKAHASSPFPHMLKDRHGNIHTTPDAIMNEMIKELVSISNNDDDDALAFNAQHKISDTELADTRAQTEKTFTHNTHKHGKQAQTGTAACDMPPMAKETKNGINKAQNDKATGKDNIPSEALKHMGDDMIALVTHMFTMMWALAITPAMLSHAITTLNHKNGPTDNVKNYRPITLLNTLHKIWERILEQRLRSVTVTAHAQMGSKAGNSATTATMTKRSILRLAKRLKTDVHSLQLDLSKAYNRVCRKTLWNKLISLGVKGKLWTAIMSTYDHADDQIRIGNRYSDPFHLDFGLRQGSILSPILFIIYVNELIQLINATDSGARGSATNINLKLACLMFVDDIETYTHTTQGLNAQFKAAITFARAHHSIFNIIKSTMTSSKGSTALQSIKHKAKIHLSVLGTTKQLGTRIKAKDITHPDDSHTSTDVATRCGTTSSMITTMSRRGLKAGDMATPDMTEIIDTIVLPTLTFGLAYTDMNGGDKIKIRSTLAEATQAALGITQIHDPTGNWATLEMGITDPVDQVTITDLATLFDMIDGKANPLAAEVVMADVDLHTAVMSTKRKWNFETGALLRTQKKARHSWLQLKARTYRIGKTNGTFFCAKGVPVWANSSLAHNHISLLTQFRSMRAHNLIPALTHCTLCRQTNIRHGTVQHFLSHCAHGAQIAHNTDRRHALSVRDEETWNSLDEASISNLCAHPHHRETLLCLALDTLKHCLLFDPEHITSASAII